MQYDSDLTLGHLALIHQQTHTESELLYGWVEQEGVPPLTFIATRDPLAEEVFIRLLELLGYNFDGLEGVYDEDE